MARIVVLDTWPLSLASNDPRKEDARRCRDWIRDLNLSGALIVVTAVADFETRRELLRAGASAGILRLDALLARLLYAPSRCLPWYHVSPLPTGSERPKAQVRVGGARTGPGRSLILLGTGFARDGVLPKRHDAMPLEVGCEPDRHRVAWL